MGKTRALTEGNIDRQLLRLTLPLLVGNLLQQLYQAADMLIVGRFLGGDAYASVGVSTTVTNLYLFILVGLCLGFSIPYANSFGAGDASRLRRQVAASGVFGLGLTAVLAGAGLLTLPWLLGLIRTPAELLPYCTTYLHIVLAGLPACLFYNLLSALLRAVGRTDLTLVFLVAAMVVNVGLDLLFVGPLGWGIAGAAWGTVIAQGVSAGLCALYLRLRLDFLWPRRVDLVWDRAVYREVTRFGAISALQQSGLFLGKLLIQSAVNAMGTLTITAYTAVACVDSLLLAVGDSGSAALSIFTAQNEGHREPRRVQEGFKRALRLMEGAAAVLVLLLLVGRGPVMELLIPPESTGALAIGSGYLLVEAPLYLLCFACSAFQGFFRGRGKLRVVFTATMVQIFLRVALTYALAAPLGLNAVAAATGIGWVVMVSIHIAMQLHFLRTEGAPQLRPASAAPRQS